MRHALGLLAIVLTLQAGLDGASLQSGPMIGYATMSEVLIWVQTDSTARVRIDYWDKSDPGHIFRTDTLTTNKHDGYIAKCLADKVQAGTDYGYAVIIDDERVEPSFRKEYRKGTIPLEFSTPANWRFRKTGHQPFDFTVGFGSCAYINEPDGAFDRMNASPYGADYRIFESIYETDPDLFIWLGDNIYYREPDWTSRTGMIHRWTHGRSIAELRPLLATTPQYAIWDDHDYGPNDSGRDFWNKKLATEVFSLFHGNPTAGMPGIPGIFTYFAWGDVHFYLLDNRTYRTTPGLDPGPFGYQPQQLGKAQIDWLIELMKYNRYQSSNSYPSTFNVVAVGGQVFSYYPKDGLHQYTAEWNYLLDRLVHEEIHNVIFLTGDVHFAEVSKMVYKGGGQPGTPGKAGWSDKEYHFWEFTSSPMTAGPWAGPDRSRNPYRIDVFPGENDRYGKRNYATLSFEGPLTQRRAVIRYYDTDGNLLNEDPEGENGEPTSASIIYARNLNLDPRLSN